MKEQRIIRIMKREVRNITSTGKTPQTGSLPDWLIYLDHSISFDLEYTLTASAKIGHRVRTFFVSYNSNNEKFTVYIDSVPYED